jgi:hypothetical protein
MWKLEWDALSTRIAGIMQASAFLFQTAQAGENDSAYSTNILIENCEETAQAVLSLLRYGNAFPPKAKQTLERFEKWWRDTTVNNFLSSPGGFPAVQAAVVMLASVRSELDQLLADHDEVIRSHVMRAFQHLQRSLVVDDALRTKWLNAFDTPRTGETSCEQLGGVHLLLHGIWAFKVSATGERTDLVLGTRLVVDQDIMASTHGLVLTEWKLVREGENPAEKKDQARHQASRYSEGSLAGFELESERYLVLVGKREFTVPDNTTDGNVKYSVIPLVLDRTTPSISARQHASH